jgi:putative addiction module component (TIGR02574 family)
MSKPVQIPPPGFDDLTLDEQIDYVQALWDRIAARPDAVPVPESHKRVIEERLKEHRENPSDVRPWGEVRERIEKELRDKSE